MVEYCEAELAVALLEMGGTMVVASGAEVVNTDGDCKLAPSDAIGIAELGALFCIKLGNASEDSVIAGAGGRLEGKEVFVELSTLVLVGSKGNGNSGRLEPGKFEAPVGNDGLNAGYCIGCCNADGIASPGGGRSKDCWWT